MIGKIMGMDMPVDPDDLKLIDEMKSETDVKLSASCTNKRLMVDNKENYHNCSRNYSSGNNCIRYIQKIQKIIQYSVVRTPMVSLLLLNGIVKSLTRSVNLTIRKLEIRILRLRSCTIWNSPAGGQVNLTIWYGI